MKRFVVDASVAVKWFVPEAHSGDAERLLDPEIQLSAPDLILPEVGNTIWKKVRRQEISAAEATEVLSAFTNMPLDLHSSEGLLAPAFEIAVALDRTVYDSMYLALAVGLDCPFVTADERFQAAVIGTPLASHIVWVGNFVSAR